MHTHITHTNTPHAIFRRHGKQIYYSYCNLLWKCKLTSVVDSYSHPRTPSMYFAWAPTKICRLRIFFPFKDNPSPAGRMAKPDYGHIGVRTLLFRYGRMHLICLALNHDVGILVDIFLNQYVPRQMDRRIEMAVILQMMFSTYFLLWK